MSDRSVSKTGTETRDSIGEYRRNRKAHSTAHVLTDTVHPRLRNAILSAELRPNSRLVEDELADWLKVSRTPIREALLLLEKEDLVGRDHGWYVREHSLQEVRERLECRMALEGFAAFLAAPRISDSDLQELRETAECMENPGLSRLDWTELNEQFHKVILDAASNHALAELHSRTRVNYRNLRVPLIFPPDANRKGHEDHRALIVALAQKDGLKAERLMRDHILMTLKIVVDALDGQSQL